MNFLDEAPSMNAIGQQHEKVSYPICVQACLRFPFRVVSDGQAL
jgi:hypothetical protein